MAQPDVTVIGGGLAGSEAAWQAARHGLHVRLVEMRPQRSTGVHTGDRLAELVCSGSLKSLSPVTASGLLNEEMRRLGSLILACGHESAIPGGSALAVDRQEFAERVTTAVKSCERIEVVREELKSIPRDGLTIVATGPLTADELADDLAQLTGQEQLAFYDAIAPTIEAESIDPDVVYAASRYQQGTPDYLNCPLDDEQYRAFYLALLTAERYTPTNPEDTHYFESCMPVEVLAERGPDTLRYGPLKPVGLEDPRTGRRPYAVVQLRQENRDATLWGMVGCQTQLRRGEQKRVFRMIPGLADAEFARYGQVHRNTFLNSPKLLQPTLQLREHPDILVAGQLVGVEGYVESAAAGLLAGLNAARLAHGEEPTVPPATTMIGALMRYVGDPWVKSFQPMNANFGILPQLHVRPKEARRRAYSERALADLETWAAGLGLG